MAPANPTALLCALLEDNGRVLFLLQKDSKGNEKLTLPGVLAGNENPVALLKEAFSEQAGIDGEIHEVVMESRWNAGSRKRKRMIPCLVFKVTAKSARCSPAKAFSGFKWLTLNEARTKPLDRKIEWLRQRK
ncbi:NUDIX hydrolase [Candidatus Micrarchaeota archaeon]|nr:NUDIX hydrolase [Candidatus Micrarchaeota archaeon]